MNIKLKQIKSFTKLPELLPPDLDDKRLSRFFGEKFDRNNILHILATLKLIELLEKSIPAQPIQDNSLPVDSRQYDKAIELIKSNNPPSSIKGLIEKTGINETLLFGYIENDAIFKSWYRVVTDKNTAKVFENVTQQALKESFENQQEHNYKASSLVLNSNKDFIKKTNNEIIEETKDNIKQLLDTIQDNIITPETNNIIEITPNEIKK